MNSAVRGPCCPLPGATGFARQFEEHDSRRVGGRRSAAP